MNFTESVEYLLSLGNEVLAMKLGLENIRKLLDALGGPQENYLKVQVAGTNGKGSVCAFLDSICRRAGVRAGVYTSPHLISITERVKIEGADISENAFARLATRVREAAEKLVTTGKLETVPTYFEQVTAIALLAFAEKKVELAILETGLGGRFDATTAAGAEIVAITRIDLDHQEYLGGTIEKIAAEKAAIIRPGVRVVIGSQVMAAERVIEGRCRETGVEPLRASADIRIKNEPVISPVLCGSITTERAHYGSLELRNMRGRHQFENAAVAIAIAETLADLGFRVTTEDIGLGIETARHPGRLESIGRFLLDGAHNSGGARALRAFLEELVQGPITLVFGAMRDKAVSEIASILWPRARMVILTRPSSSRALTADELFQAKPESLDESRIMRTEEVTEAIEKAKAITPEAGLIVVTGSLYLVGEARQVLTCSASVN